MSRIKKITVSNLKAVSKITADFNGCTAIITGGNNKGKSSFLKSLPDRLRGIKPEIVLKEGESEGFAEMELTTGEKFIWKFNNTTKAGEKLTFISKDNIKESVSKAISEKYFPQTFDIDRFLNDQPKKQKETLQKIIGIDFTEIDDQYKTAYADRTYKNNVLKSEKAKEVIVNTALPVEEIPTLELQKELLDIDNHNANVSRVKEGVASRVIQVKENLDSITELLEKIEELKRKNAVIEDEIEKADKWLEQDKNKPKGDAERAGLEARIQNIINNNKLIVANNKAIEQAEVIRKAKEAADLADEAVKIIEKKKSNLLELADMPEGFEFTEDGILYNGLPLTKEQVSSSGIYIAALKLAYMNIGEVKTLHFDASYLDKNSLADIEKWAKENDLQLLIERPDFDGGEIKYELIEE